MASTYCRACLTRREKSHHADLRAADIKRSLALVYDIYRAIITSVILTTGHVGSKGLGQLLVVCDTTSNLVITVKTVV